MQNVAQQQSSGAVRVLLVGQGQLRSWCPEILSQSELFVFVPEPDLASACRRMEEGSFSVLLVIGQSVGGGALDQLVPDTQPEVVVLMRDLTPDVWAAELLAGASEVLPLGTPREHLSLVLRRAAQRCVRRWQQRAVQFDNPLRDVALDSQRHVA